LTSIKEAPARRWFSGMPFHGARSRTFLLTCIKAPVRHPGSV